MSLRVHEDLAAAEYNKAVKGIDIESIGPVAVEVWNQGPNKIITSFEKLDGSAVLSDADTAVSAEDTGYIGTGAQLEFTGEALDNLPVIPGTVVVIDVGAVAPNLIDKNRDGLLYTDDADEDLAGTIDYFTGALALDYPTGKAPGTGATAINADYAYQDSSVVKGGKKLMKINNVLQGEHVIAKCAADAKTGAQVKLNGVSSWDQ